MLALENQIDDLVPLMEEGASAPDSRSGRAVKEKKVVSKPCYTKMQVKVAPKHQRYRRAQMKEIVTSQPADSGGSIPIIDNEFQGWSPQGVIRYNRLRDKVKNIENMNLVLSAIRETCNCSSI